jgi:hypothetical protein
VGVAAVATGCVMEQEIAHEPALGQEASAIYGDGALVSENAPDWPQRPPDQTFTFSTETDVISLVMASDGLFASIPAGIMTLDEPEIRNGFIGSFKAYDEGGQLVAFGTKHEEFVPPTPISMTSYMLTLPGRGALMLEATQDVTPFYEEIADMISSGDPADLVRSFEPPLTIVTTVPGTGRIIGGTGEFANTRGVWREIQALHGLDLIERTLADTLTLELWQLPRGPQSL